MKDKMLDADEYLDSAILLEGNSYRKKYLVSCQDGKGYMTSYEVFDGIKFFLNDFHSVHSPTEEYSIDKPLLEINHCLRGSYECKYDDNKYAYLSEGDLGIAESKINRYYHQFPLGYYYGIEIAIDVVMAKNNPLLKEFHIDIPALYEKTIKNNRTIILKSNSTIQHILWDIYQQYHYDDLYYLRIKVIELLYYIQNTSILKQQEVNYYMQEQVEKVKQIKEYLSNHLDKYDIHDLCQRYHINISTLRKCFKDIYGKPIHRWHKEYRLNRAKELLESTDYSIIEISNRVGWENPSKFSSSFHQYIGDKPMEYRKKHKS